MKTLNFQVFEGLICLQIQDGNSADWLPHKFKFELLSQLTKQNKERMLNLDKICRFQSESNSIINYVFEIALQYQFLEYFHGSDKEK